jgi:CheY-like chemotaxis protein
MTASQAQDALHRASTKETVRSKIMIDAPLHAPASHRRHRACHVLVAEDDETNAGWVEAALEYYDCTVRVVSNGAAALAAGMDERFHLILMDCAMPVMDGIESTQAIRSFEAWTGRRRTPIVAVTARVMPDERQRCIDAGMDGVLAKPFMLEELDRVLTYWARPLAKTGTDG